LNSLQLSTRSAASFLTLPAGTSFINFNVAFDRSDLYSEVFFGHPDAEINESGFHIAEEHKANLESAFGDPLHWDTLPGERGSRIAVYIAGQEPYS
jgi:Domain of unknown function (DUF4268)